ncbi:hypothetical protein T492DRAFT_1110180 [Pavlovales sp. CCMP2436]|nr:hypothetical protein T492DRAFT_1110180 [Pavlovales sp. CCMP2436]
MLDATGVDAYTRRPSFRDPAVDLGAAVTGGCPGFAALVPALHWREEALLGGIERAPLTDTVRHAKALRATVLLAGDVTISRRLGLDVSEAKALGDAFRLAMEHLIPAVPLHASRASVFVADAFLRVIEEHVGSASTAVGAGYVLMVLYVLAVLRTPKLALAGIALLLCDLAGGFGLACLLGVPSSILTLTVLPFVALGIAVDGLFLILHTFQATRKQALAVGDVDGARPSRLVPLVTRAVGPSILFTGCTNGAAYAAASTIPLHAIINFSRQCGILLFFNAAVTLVGVPALIAIVYAEESPASRAAKEPASPPADGSSPERAKREKERASEKERESECAERASPPARVALAGSACASPPHLAPQPSEAASAASTEEGKPRQRRRSSPSGRPVGRACEGGLDGLMHTCAQGLARLVISPRGHRGLMCAFAALTLFALWGISWMQPGLILSELVPSTDITSVYLTAEGDYFSFFPVTVATKAVAYESPAVQTELLALRARIALMPEAVQPLPPFWLHYLLGYANATGALGADGLLAREEFYPTLRAWRESDPLAFAQSQGNFGYGERGELVYAEIPLFVHGVQEPKQCIAFVGELQALCDEASAHGLPSYALGLPFYRCERYVHLRFWCVRGVCIALSVVFVVSVVFMGALREATLMSATLFFNLVQLAGLLAFVGMKINGALVMATVASIGCASEYAGHFTMAFLQARGTHAERITFAYERSLHPLFDSACSTVLGVVMIAFAAFPFVVKYFFVPMVILTILNFANAVLLLPCLLLLLGRSQHTLPLAAAADDECARLEAPAPTPPSAATPEPTPPPAQLRARSAAAASAASEQLAQPSTPEPPSEWLGDAQLAWEPSPAKPWRPSEAPTEQCAGGASAGRARVVLFPGYDLSDEAAWGTSRML